MKKSIKRILSLLMSCAMAASMLGTVAFAEESTDPIYDSEYSYALNYTGNYSANQWQYFSPYMPSWSYDGAFDCNNTIAFTLVDTINNEGFPVYCTDIDTGLDSNSNFRRLNLEDSTYASAGAGLLRAIMLKGFPNVGVDDLGKDAGVENLTIGEAVTATQTAVWKAAHGNLVEFKDFVYSFDTQWGADATVHYDECMDEINNGYASSQNETLIEAKIEKVFNYLINLDPMAPQELTVSTASFKEWSKEPALVKNEDGTYNVTVTATVDVTVKEGDSLNLTASVGECSTSAALVNGKNELSLTIANVPADDAYGVVTIAIAGKQTVKDVFLFDAEGNRDASQSLVGILGTQLPVYAEIKVEPERILNFYKTTKIVTGQDEDGKDTYTRVPLEGIQFDLYYAVSLSDYLNGTKLDYSYSGQPTYTVTTDAEGKASVSLSKNEMPDGVYLVVERENSSIKAPADPFYVMLPYTNTSGDGWLYEVTVEPKNDVIGEIEIDKDVIELGNNSATVNAGEAHTWIITASIPVDIADGKEYVITDKLDSRLTYVADSLKVKLENSVDNISEPAVLTAGTDYTLTVENQTITIALTKAGMKKAGEVVTSGVIRVYFDTKINSTAGMGENIPNNAHLDYTNGVNFDFDADSDVPEVHTGGANLLKVNGKDTTKTLSGATFQVYRPATATEIALYNSTEVADDEKPAIEYIDGVSSPVILAAFYDNAELDGEKVTSATSDENGKVVIYGLAYGTYYLVETAAPEGFNLLTEAKEITIDADSHTEAEVVTVLNFSGFELPETGGIGTTIYTAMGTLMICAAGAYIILSKKRVVC